MKHKIKTTCTILLSFLLTISAFQTNAQFNITDHIGGDKKWKNVGASCSDPSGNLILTGTFYSGITFGSTTLGGSNIIGQQWSNPYLDCFVSKFNTTTGTYSWAKKIECVQTSSKKGSNSSPSIYYGRAVIRDVKTDTDGNIYLCGEFWNTVKFDNITLTGNGTTSASLSSENSDGFIAKINSNGAFQWVKKFGSNVGHDGALGMAVGGSSVYVTGFFTKKDIACVHCFPRIYIYDIYIGKFNSSGTLQWEKRIADTKTYTYSFGNEDASSNKGSCIQIDGSGNLLVSGRLKGNVVFESSLSISKSVNEIFLAKFNSSGVTQWVREPGEITNYNSSYSNSDSKLPEHVLDNSGNIMLAGDTSIAKYNASGSLQWRYHLPVRGNYPLNVMDMFFMPAGNISLILAQSNQSSTLIAHYNWSGNLVDSFESFGRGRFYASSGVTTSSGYYLMANAIDTVKFKNVSLYADTNYFVEINGQKINNVFKDFYIIEYNPSLYKTSKHAGIKIGQDAIGLKLYPNPAENFVTISSGKEKQSLILTDINGRDINQYEIYYGTNTLDISSLKPGVYFIRSIDNNYNIKMIRK